MTLVMKQTHVRLGQIVRDIASGLTGLAVGQVDMLSGSVQISVQPKSKDGVEYPNAYDIDVVQLVVVEDPAKENTGYTQHFDHLFRDLQEDVVVELGDLVRDRITGYSGIAIERHQFLNGCIYFTAHGETYDDESMLPGAMRGAERLDHKRWDVEEKGAYQADTEASKAAGHASQSANNGPSVEDTGAPVRRTRRP